MKGDGGHEPHWYYATAGERHGPTSEQRLADLIRTRTITSQSLVWNPTMTGWQCVSASPLAIHLTAETMNPPPLTGDAVDNSIVWVLAFAPLIGVLLEGIVGGIIGAARESLWFITLILNVLLASADATNLRKAGHETSKMGAAWLVPVYLFKRAKLLRQNNAYFVVWCVLFALLLMGVL